MLTRVYFLISFVSNNDMHEITEDSLLGNPAELAQILSKQNTIEGAIVIELNNGTIIQIDDELPTLIQNFCFISVIKLAHETQDSYVYYYMTCNYKVIFTPMADLIKIVGDDFEPILCEKDILLKELLECGMRFLNMISHLGNQTKNLVDYLAPFAQNAKNVFNDKKFQS